MEDNHVKAARVSRTAESAAISRVMETFRPQGERLIEDRFALGFIKNPIRKANARLMRFRTIRDAIVTLQDRILPGGLGMLIGRTLYLDDALRRALEGGVEQVVILGTGFDSRPYRIPGIEKTRVFEVDQPGTIAWKQTCLKKMLGALPEHVVFVPIDFNQQYLVDELAAAGFGEGAKTFFIWEGVTQYITPEAVDATFSAVAHLAGPGSSIAFTYIHKAVIEGTSDIPNAQKAASGAALSGEHWLFGIDPAKLGDFLAERGFTLIEQAGAREFQERYLIPAGRSMEVLGVESVALASLAKP
jgi:methyltransferase (TIGR00027 family)